MKQLKVLVMVAFLILLAACNNSANEKGRMSSRGHNSMTANTPSKNGSISKYEIGDSVPHELVCMVNDAFMNEKQILVPVNGKNYYGCCPMCKDKLANEVSARTATDPVTNNKVDKSNALIAIAGDKGVVAYFENVQSYKLFFKKK